MNEIITPIQINSLHLLWEELARFLDSETPKSSFSFTKSVTEELKHIKTLECINETLQGSTNTVCDRDQAHSWLIQLTRYLRKQA